MKPIDFRNETFESLQGRLAGLRALAWEAWRQHGPGTTREVARRCGMEILTFRPRTTELLQMGFLAVSGSQTSESGTEGIYRALTIAEVRAAFEREKAAARQPELALS